jgi:hypothetical protein
MDMAKVCHGLLDARIAFAPYSRSRNGDIYDGHR